MLLTNTRLRLLFICLTGMEMAVLSPYLLLLLSFPALWHSQAPLPQLSPWTLLAGLWSGLLAMMLFLDLLNRSRLKAPAYALTVLAAMVLSGMAGVRLFLYWGTPLGQWRWLAGIAAAVVDFHHGLRPELLFLALSFLLWQRATSATSRSLSFFGVGVSFRLGVLFLLLGGGLLAGTSRAYATSAQFFLYAFFALGLLAVALARIDDKAAQMGGSTGSLLPPTPLLQLLAAVGITVGLWGWLSGYYTPANLRVALAWFAPLWNLLARLFLVLLMVVFSLLEPVLRWLQIRIQALLAGSDLFRFFDRLSRSLSAFQASNGDSAPVPGMEVPPWVWVVGRAALVAVALVLMLGFIFLFLERRRQRTGQEDPEKTGRAAGGLDSSLLRQGWQRLRNLAGLVRRYGLGNPLLAAISVENIYANLARLAHQRGYPRHPAQPPDEYLAALRRAFPLCDDALARITDAYMRIHYGDHPVDAGELKQLQEDYQAIRRRQPPIGPATQLPP